MLHIARKAGSGELLPRLFNILDNHRISVSKIYTGRVHVGLESRGALFLAKSSIWNNQISTQKGIVERCATSGKWIVFWIPEKGFFKFLPNDFLTHGWTNLRGQEVMMNLSMKYAQNISEIDIDPIEHQQLSISR